MIGRGDARIKLDNPSEFMLDFIQPSLIIISLGLFEELSDLAFLRFRQNPMACPSGRRACRSFLGGRRKDLRGLFFDLDLTLLGILRKFREGSPRRRENRKRKKKMTRLIRYSGEVFYNDLGCRDSDLDGVQNKVVG